MRLNQRIGGAPPLALICLCVIYSVSTCTAEDKPSEASGGLYDVVAAGPAQPPAERLDLSRPVQTTRGALVCPQEVLWRAVSSPRAADSMEAVYDAFGSSFNRIEKARALGCDEWRPGIQAVNAARMSLPFDGFVGFSRSQEALARGYFTVPSHLENSPPRPRHAQRQLPAGAVGENE